MTPKNPEPNIPYGFARNSQEELRPRTIIIPPSMKVELNCPALWAGSFTVWEVADSPTPSRKRGFAILSDRLEWP